MSKEFEHMCRLGCRGLAAGVDARLDSKTVCSDTGGTNAWCSCEGIDYAEKIDQAVETLRLAAMDYPKACAAVSMLLLTTQRTKVWGNRFVSKASKNKAERIIEAINVLLGKCGGNL